MLNKLVSLVTNAVAASRAKMLPLLLSAVAAAAAVITIFNRGYRAGADRARAEVARRDAMTAERARAVQQSTLEAQIQQRPASLSETAALLRNSRKQF